MNTTTRTLTAFFAAAVLAIAAVPAEAQGRHGGFGHYRGGHGGHGGRGWGGPVIGLGIGIGLGAYYGGYWGPYYPYYPYYPGYVVVDGTSAAPAYVTPPPAQPAGSTAPDPVIYPRSGQSPAQTEADRQECNRWATTQPAAMADAGVFQRAVAACLDGRGYTVR